MNQFPAAFVDSTQILPDSVVTKASAQIQLLADIGYEVQMGMTADMADQVLTMSQQPSIREFCPRDSAERFTDRAATERWLAKKRMTFLLFKKEDNGGLSLSGYGWAGAASSQHVPGGETTFAVRIGEAGQGQGLAAPFSWLIVASSAILYDARNFWLETWASNGGAVHVYHKIGFETVAEQPDERPTLNGEQVSDTRIYMSLANELLPAQPEIHQSI